MNSYVLAFDRKVEDYDIACNLHLAGLKVNCFVPGQEACSFYQSWWLRLPSKTSATTMTSRETIAFKG